MEESEQLRVREQRLVYLVTYSRADLEKVPTRKAFAEAVKEVWLKTTGVRVTQWVVSQEMHAEVGRTSCNIFHCHMGVKIEKRTQWLTVRNFLDEKHGIKVHFSSNHNTYYSAYKYTTKEDKDFALSDGHPDLENSSPPRTECAISEKKSKGKARQKGNGGSRKGRKRGLSVYDVTELIQQKKIKCRLELMCLAASQNRQGKRDLGLG